MSSKQPPPPPTTSTNPEILKILGERAYHRIDEVAKKLCCTKDDLLHMAAIGKVELCAPVVAPGRFEWPTGSERVAYPEVEGTLIYNFGPTDRVALSIYDLAHMEGVGWTIPRWFYSPATAREAINAHCPTLAEALAEQKERQRFLEANADKIRQEVRSALDENPDLDDEEKEQMLDDHEQRGASLGEISEHNLLTMREEGFHAAWHAADDFAENTTKTTVEHLFVSASEYARLLKREPQDEATLSLQRNRAAAEAKPNAHHERYAVKRSEVLMAALWCCKDVLLSQKLDAAKILGRIEKSAIDLWPTLEGELPRSNDSVEKLLRKALYAEAKDVLKFS